MSRMDKDAIEAEIFRRYDLTKAFLIYLGFFFFLILLSPQKKVKNKNLTLFIKSGKKAVYI